MKLLSLVLLLVSAIFAGAEEQAPSYRAKTIDGEALDSGALQGKVVVLNFWFSGCPPCKTEIPDLNTLVDEFAGKDVVFIGFSLNAPAHLKEFLVRVPFRYKIVPESDKIAKRFEVAMYPTHIVIDRSGQVVKRMERVSDKDVEILREAINKALEKSK